MQWYFLKENSQGPASFLGFLAVREGIAVDSVSNAGIRYRSGSTLFNADFSNQTSCAKRVWRWMC
eukprot:2077286-Amphidinium_carterae.1